jgi:hypothetical protein
VIFDSLAGGEFAAYFGSVSDDYEISRNRLILGMAEEGTIGLITTLIRTDTGRFHHSFIGVAEAISGTSEFEVEIKA